jgi:protein-S-isoprenylcysteine O-methyltransferase Ste14
MTTLRLVILVTWAVFWVGWILAAAAGVKQGSGGGRRRLPGLAAVLGFVLVRIFSPHTLAIHSVPLEVIGTILFASGLGLAIWARVYLGRNWGMPMTEKAEPELVTSGPYKFVRHPIYSGILLALVGTALATNLYWLIAVCIVGAYFVYSASVEERIMTSSFPATYPSYRERTKMLIPFVL